MTHDEATSFCSESACDKSDACHLVTVASEKENEVVARLCSLKRTKGPDGVDYSVGCLLGMRELPNERWVDDVTGEEIDLFFWHALQDPLSRDHQDSAAPAADLR